MKAWQGSIALSDFRGIVSPAYFVYRPTHEFSRKYFHYLMRSAPYIGEYNRISKGVRIGQWDLDPTYFRTTQLIVPPPEEQHAIADFLDRETAKIDKLIAKQEQLITTLGERREAVVLRGVTRGFRFDVSFRSCRSSWMFEIPQDWQESRTRFHCQVSTGSGDTQDSVDEGKYPFYVRSDTPLRSPRFEFDGDAVLTAGDGAGVGKVFHLASGKFMAHQRVYVMNNFKGVTPKFFFYFFSSTFARVALDGTAKSTVDSLRRPMLTNHSMFVPSISEQIEIVTILDTLVASIDALVVAAENVTKLLKERRGSLISAAVTGELEVAR
jgi:type I restriction enzyme S subunit